MPAELRARSRRTWRATPTATRRRCPRSPPRSGARLVLARGDPPGGRGDAGDARLPVVGRDLLRHAATEPTAAATCTCAPAWPATCATRRRSTTRSPRRRATRASRTWRSASSSASARATWRRWRPWTAATSARSTDRATHRSSWRAIKEGREVLPGRGLTDPDYQLPWAEELGMSEIEAAHRATSTSPACTRSAVYERLGGYSAMRKALTEMDARGGARRARGLRPARPRRRRLLDGQEGELHPQGRDGQVPLLQRRRVRAGHVQGPPADAEEPAPADRGLHHRLDRRRARTRRSSSSAASTSSRRTSSTPPWPRPTRRATSASASSAPSTRPRPRGAPRPGRLHLRRGDRRCSTRSRASAATRA